MTENGILNNFRFAIGAMAMVGVERGHIAAAAAFSLETASIYAFAEQ
jgi:hypothetical protein